MSTYETINLYTGLVRHDFVLTSYATLENVRYMLVNDEKRITEDEEGSKWRFLIKVIEIDTDKTATIPYQDAILGKELERMMNAKEFLDGKNALYLVNIDKKTPDLFGLKVNKFMQERAQCCLVRNTYISPDKVNPLSLERVRALKNISTTYNNVLICNKETAIIFLLSAKGCSAFAFRITSDAGDVIVDELISFTTNFDDDTPTSLTRYQSEDKAIVVDAIPTSIPSDERYKRSRVNIEMWNVTSVTNMEGRTITFPPPRPFDDTFGRDGIVLPSDGIESGMIRGGDNTDEKFGTVKSYTVDRNNVLGVIQVDLFVFKSMEDADRIFEMNCLEKQ